MCRKAMKRLQNLPRRLLMISEQRRFREQLMTQPRCSSHSACLMAATETADCQKPWL